MDIVTCFLATKFIIICGLLSSVRQQSVSFLFLFFVFVSPTEPTATKQYDLLK